MVMMEMNVLFCIVLIGFGGFVLFFGNFVKKDWEFCEFVDWGGGFYSGSCLLVVC